MGVWRRPKAGRALLWPLMRYFKPELWTMSVSPPEFKIISNLDAGTIYYNVCNVQDSTVQYSVKHACTVSEWKAVPTDARVGFLLKRYLLLSSSTVGTLLSYIPQLSSRYQRSTGVESEFGEPLRPWHRSPKQLVRMSAESSIVSRELRELRAMTPSQFILRGLYSTRHCTYCTSAVLSLRSAVK